jgi:Nif-specific regulatory protein
VADESPELLRLRRENGLFRRLLELGRQDEPEPFLREALGLIVDVTGAQQGYIELHDHQHPEVPFWSLAHGFTSEQIDDVRAAISHGIIAEAIASGKTIVTQSAFLDDRFSLLRSVRLGHIEGVLCAPIGDDAPRGVVYLQKPKGESAFTALDRNHAETFAWHLATLADRVLAQRRTRAVEDPTAPVREKFRAMDVIGRSAGLAAVLEQAALVSPLDVHVLLTGETGTGKSQLARVIHDNGPRARGPFVTLNCAALPETLVESELFGALPGAHSTAVRKIEGKVASAEGGTLFLDEIGELTAGAQAKLLHLLQAKEYYPLGGTKPVRANLRVIAATNTDLREAVAEHRFREDLLYRLEVLPIRVPSLAERREDIALLAAFFCSQACNRHGFAQLKLSPNALHAVECAEWPGNIRQLENGVEAAVIRAAGRQAREVERSHLFPDDAAGSNEPKAAMTFQEATRMFQARFVQDALEAHGWNVIETARGLDITRSHVYNLIKAFGLERMPPDRA